VFPEASEITGEPRAIAQDHVVMSMSDQSGYFKLTLLKLDGHLASITVGCLQENRRPQIPLWMSQVPYHCASPVLVTHAAQISTCLVKHIALFARDSRDLREKRDGSDISSSRIAPVVHILHVSLTIHDEEDDQRSGSSRWLGACPTLPS